MKNRLIRQGLIPLLAVAVTLLLAPGLFHASEMVWYTDQVAVIAYHQIDNQTTGDVTITAERFKEQLTDLLQRGYHFISLQQFRDYMAGAAVPANAVLITFDDGYESFYTQAYPILKELNIAAVNFVITKDLEHPEATRIPSLSRDEVRQMKKERRGMEAQCHSDSLHDSDPDGSPLLTTHVKREGRIESNADFDRRIAEDTKRCISRLRELNTPVDAYAYPFGSYDAHTIQLLSDAGIRYAFTTTPGIVDRETDPMQIPRINGGSPFVKANSLNNLIIRKLYQQRKNQDVSSRRSCSRVSPDARAGCISAP